MDFDIAQLIVWLIVGAVAGSLCGRMVKGKKEGFGNWANLGIGLIGAVVGGLLFDLIGIDYGMSRITVSLQDLVSAVVGSLLFILGVWVYRKVQQGKKTMPSA